MSFTLLGLLAGILSGFIGVGGGVIIVPALVFFFNFTQKMAQGTTIALLIPPIGILAAWTYYKQGDVNIKAAALICLGFVLGGLIGAKFATNMNNDLLRKIFAVILVLIGLQMFLKK